MLNFYRLLLIICAILILNATQTAAQTDKDAQPATNSTLNNVRLPAGAQRVNDRNVPAEITDTLGKLVALGNGKMRQGESEVLIWSGASYRKSSATSLVQKITENMQNAGWTYAVGEQNGEFTVFNSINTNERRAIIGFWTAKTDFLMLAWTEMLSAGSTNIDSPKNSKSNANNATVRPNANDIDGAAKIINVEKNQLWVNVMGNETPEMPDFPRLVPKPGRVRGYAKDWTGKPLANAAIGVRASYFAGQYSGAQGTTDAKGYYEFVVPKGSAHFYNAGYQIEWGEGVAAVGLHPADGKTDSFVTADGAVENFVLLPYGITSRENLQESAHLPSTFYGGAIFLNWYSAEANDDSAPPFAVREGATLEITLTPEGKMFGGAAGQTIIIRTVLGMSGSFRIHNIPLARYRISIEADGKPLKITDNKQYNSMFGLTPTEAVGEASLLFVPGEAKASMTGTAFGAWKWASLNISAP